MCHLILTTSLTDTAAQNFAFHEELRPGKDSGMAESPR